MLSMSLYALSCFLCTVYNDCHHPIDVKIDNFDDKLTLNFPHFPEDLEMSPIPGEAGVDYPVFNNVPDTGFDCASQDTPGIYTDTQAQCQVAIKIIFTFSVRIAT